MAFGDIKEVVEATTGDYDTTVTATYVSATPVAGDLNFAGHFAGDDTSNVDTAGFTEDQLLTDVGNADEGGMYSQLVTGSGDNTVTCSSPNADVHMLIFVLIEGEFASTPKDLSGAGATPTAANPASSGTSGATAQADAVLVGMMTRRDGTEETGGWTRLGTATPTSAMTERGSLPETVDTSKVNQVATQLLTAIGTVGFTRANSGASDSMCGYVVYAKDSGGGGGGRIMSSLAKHGGLAYKGGIAGSGGGLAA